MPDVREQIRWFEAPLGARLTESSAEGWHGPLASTFALLAGAFVLSFTVGTGLRSEREETRTIVAAAICIILILIGGGAYALFDRYYMQVRIWRKSKNGDSVADAFAEWRSAHSRVWRVRATSRALFQACRSCQPPVITIAPAIHRAALAPQASMQLLEPEPITARLDRPIMRMGGLVCALISLILAYPLTQIFGAYAPLVLFLLILWTGLYLGSAPVKIEIGSGVVEHRGRRWTVDDSAMFVTRAAWTAVCVRLVGEHSTLTCRFRSAENRQFLALWQRWNTAMPKTNLPAITT